MTLGQFQDAMQRGVNQAGWNGTDKILRVRVLDLGNSYKDECIVDYEIKEVNFDENSGTLYIETN